MINSKIVTGNTITTPTKVFTSSNTGAEVGGTVVGQVSAITNIILCNTLAPTLTDETINSTTVNIYLVSPDKPIDLTQPYDNRTVSSGSLIVSNLIVPAGETVFFSEERIILSAGDEIHVGCHCDTTTPAMTVTVSSLPV